MTHHSGKPIPSPELNGAHASVLPLSRQDLGRRARAGQALGGQGRHQDSVLDCGPGALDQDGLEA